MIETDDKGNIKDFKSIKNMFPDGVEFMIMSKKDYNDQLIQSESKRIQFEYQIEKALEYLDAMISSDTILNGEYFVVHSDNVFGAINNLKGENNVRV